MTLGEKHSSKTEIWYIFRKLHDSHCKTFLNLPRQSGTLFALSYNSSVTPTKEQAMPGRRRFGFLRSQ